VGCTPIHRSRPPGEAARDLSSAPDARAAQYSEYECVVNELYSREVFCVHHELERFNFNPRTHRRDTHIRGRARPYSKTSPDQSDGGDGAAGSSGDLPPSPPAGKRQAEYVSSEQKTVSIMFRAKLTAVDEPAVCAAIASSYSTNL
jgi:hypothetical protein